MNKRISVNPNIHLGKPCITGTTQKTRDRPHCPQLNSQLYTSFTKPHTIYLAEGVYGPSTNGDSLPIIPKEYVTISGASEDNTIIDGEGIHRVIHAEYLDNYTIENLTIQNGLAENGGGIFCTNSSPSIKKQKV